MAQLGTSFKPTEHDTTQNEYTNLPDMVADLEIIQSEIKETSTKNGKGKMLTLRYSIVEPEDYKGRLVFGNITLEHDKSDTQEIGQKTFARLCRAMEIQEEVTDSDELHFKSFRAKIGMGKPSKDKNPDGTPVYPAKNELKAFYYPDEGNMPDVGLLGPAAANDNHRPAANDNTPAKGDARTTGNGGAAATKSRPWGKKAA